MTEIPPCHIEHGIHLVFSIERAAPEALPHDISVMEVASDTYGIGHDEQQLLQTSVSSRRHRLLLHGHVPPPQMTKVDCQKVLFIREQLRGGFFVYPTTAVDTIWWHPSTWTWSM